MSILSDITIKELANDPTHPMIVPFEPESVRFNKDGEKIPSYGLSSYGYDVQLAPTFKIFSNVNAGVIDPLNPQGDEIFHEVNADHCILPPHSYLLSHTVETFNIPRDVLVLCVGKSTWARLAIAVNVTPIEPEFKGQVVIEIANLTSLPVVIHAGVGICQFLFLKGDKPCDVSYSQRDGKYNGQTGITLAK